MKWFILVVAIIVLCFLVALILGLAGGGLGRATTSLSHEPLPDEPIHDADFDDLVFDVGARGYRMSQVDGVVDRLRRELREKDEEIAVLRGAEAPVRSPEAAETGEPAETTETTEPAETGEPAAPTEALESAGTPHAPAPTAEAPAPSEPTVGREPTT